MSIFTVVLAYLAKVTSFFNRQDKVVETLTEECGLNLEPYITRKEEGIPDHSWTIIQCKNCSEYNLL